MGGERWVTLTLGVLLTAGGLGVLTRHGLEWEEEEAKG